jgi:hypothetical protein
MTVCVKAVGLRRLFVALMIVAISLRCVGQTPTQQTRSIGDAVRESKADEPVHIVYIHGIGSEAAGESQLLQKSICDNAKRYLGTRCVLPAGAKNKEFWTLKYRHFADTMPMPQVAYMGKAVWTVKEGNWPASTPFVDRYELGLENGKRIVVDELNWWPMMLAFKCRHILKYETELAGTLSGANDYLKLCEMPTSTKRVDGIETRTYMWLSGKQGSGENDLPTKPADYREAILANRFLKVYLMDWRFSDAILGLGTLESDLVAGIRVLLEDCVREDFSVEAPKSNYITVSHSLGSFLVFSALHLSYDSRNLKEADKKKLGYLLQHLSQAYFFANQIPLLELAKLNSLHETQEAGSPFEPETDSFDLKDWSENRRNSLLRDPIACTDPTGMPLGEIVSWSDSNDLLTWYLGKDFEDWQTHNHDAANSINGICVTNYVVKNASHILGLLELPGSAHDNYAKNPEVIKSLLKPLGPKH